MSDTASPADLGDEPEGFWEPVQAEIDAWAAKYLTGQEDDGEPD